MPPGHTERAGTLRSVPPEGGVGARPAAQGDVGVEPAPLALSCRKSTIKWCEDKGMEGSENVSPQRCSQEQFPPECRAQPSLKQGAQGRTVLLFSTVK